MYTIIMKKVMQDSDYFICTHTHIIDELQYSMKNTKKEGDCEQLVSTRTIKKPKIKTLFQKKIFSVGLRIFPSPIRFIAFHNTIYHLNQTSHSLITFFC